MRVLRKRLVKEKTGLSSASIDRKERAGDFPVRIQLGTKAVGWIEAEIDAWIEKRRDERDRKVVLTTAELPEDPIDPREEIGGHSVAGCRAPS
jgi:prophage regulatory protein